MMKYLQHIIVTAGIFLITGHLNAQTVTISMDSTRQLIRGFGGIQIPDWTGTELNADISEKAFGNDPGKLGLSILRLFINPDSNSFYRVLPMARHATNSGAILFASPWDPPAYMLDPASSPTKRLHEDYYDDYVDHLNRFNSFMTDSGVPLYAISVQNEPDYGDWTRWTSGEMVKFLEENAQDINNRVLAPESFQFRRTYTDPILNDPEASANVDIIGGHIYGGGLFDYPLAREKGKEVWMTEHYTSSDRSANLWPDALLVGTEITNCMNANFNAYVWWYIRRFYGPITDDGMISKRGYVMSQFSKFVRPGAYRVDAIVSGVSGVDASAFKTDSTLVIVVVNSTNTEVGLDLIIQNNAGINTLTKFTTSGTKNVVNDGSIDILDDTLSSTVDAYSITTFTSSAGNGGKPNNQNPVADAGNDIILDDIDGNGVDTILLDGGGSTDPDGLIANYSWSLNGQQVAWTETTELTVAIGQHVVVLGVTDEDGAVHSDTINVILNSIYSTELWFEAECAIVGSNWEINEDNNASNDKYINTPAGTELISGASADTSDQLIINFITEEPGAYKVWARVITPSANDDSYWVQVDTGSWANWNSIPASNNWHWDDVHNGGPENPVVYNLEAGEHTLRICYREDGALLDKIYITNTGTTPVGIGEADTACPEDPIIIDGIEQETFSQVEIFPNPASTMIHITSSESFKQLEIISLTGVSVYRENYGVPASNADVSLNLDSGIWLLRLTNEKSSVIRKFVIQKE